MLTEENTLQFETNRLHYNIVRLTFNIIYMVQQLDGIRRNIKALRLPNPVAL